MSVVGLILEPEDSDEDEEMVPVVSTCIRTFYYEEISGKVSESEHTLFLNFVGSRICVDGLEVFSNHNHRANSADKR